MRKDAEQNARSADAAAARFKTSASAQKDVVVSLWLTLTSIHATAGEGGDPLPVDPPVSAAEAKEAAPRVLAALRARLESADSRARRAREQAARCDEQKEAAESVAGRARAEADSAKAELAAARADRDAGEEQARRAARDAAAAKAEVGSLQAELAQATARLQETREELDDARETSRKELSRRADEAHRRELEQADAIAAAKAEAALQSAALA